MDQVGVAMWVSGQRDLEGSMANPSWGPFLGGVQWGQLQPYLKFICILKCSDGNVYLHYTLQ